MLKQRELLTPAVFILSLLVVLSLIIVLGQFFHQSLQDEMAEQFNQQQLLLAREVAMNIESFVDHVYKNLKVISQLPQIDRIHLQPACKQVAESINFSLQDEALVTIRVIGKNGILLYDSSYPGRERVDLSHTDYFKRAQVLPRNEKLVTDLMELHSPNELETKEFIVATPIYLRTGRSLHEFSGVVLAVLSMEGITRKYLSPIRSGQRGYAWMMDSDGTLLYHPTQPSMVGKNLYHSDSTCFQCHKSFKAEKAMIEGASQTFGYYVAPGGKDMLAAYYRLPMAKKAWIVVVSAPKADVLALMQKSMLFYSLLIMSIFVTTVVASGVSIITYRKKIKAEERTKHLENQQRLEHEIELSKNYLESIVENTKTNLMVLDKDLRVKSLNTAQARILGRDKQALLGKPFSSLFPDELVPYDDIPMVTILQKALSGRSFEIKDYRITSIRKAPLYLELNVSPLLIDGKTPGILLTSNDVTKRVELEEALKQYTVELEDKVDKGTATAKQLEQQVMHSEKLAALGRLAAGVAHEIGNPLTSISTFAQLLREMATDEFTQNSLDIINNHIQRITEIVRQMSTFSRAASTNIKYAQLNEVLQSTLDLMRLDKRMKHTIDITVSMDPELPRTMIDEGQATQVFINIILNALDAMPNGGHLQISTSQGKDDQGKDSIFVAFADTGCGIPQNELAKIFDPFYTTKEIGKGTGLGLSVSYNIIKRLNGDITVCSEVGRGTVFKIIIPIEQEK